MWRWLCDAVDFFITDLAFKLVDETGGGSDPQPPQVFPAPQPPDVGETAGDVAQVRLQYDPLLARQQASLQQELAPGQAQLQTDIFAQQSPLLKSLIMQLFPSLGTLEGQVGQQLSSPTGLTPQQQAAQDAIRQRAYDASSRGIQQSANLGGTLFGGNRELREDRARNELAQGFATQDIQLQQQQRQQAMSELATLLQLAFPQVQQPNVPGGNQLGLSQDALFNALIANQGNFAVTS